MTVKIYSDGSDPFSLTEEIMGIVAGVLILIVALSWNDLGKHAFDNYFPKDTTKGKLLYCGLLTVFVIIFLHFILKWFRKWQSKGCSEYCDVKKKLNDAGVQVEDVNNENVSIPEPISTNELPPVNRGNVSTTNIANTCKNPNILTRNISNVQNASTIPEPPDTKVRRKREMEIIPGVGVFVHR